MSIIAVDFDGCLCENAWPRIGAPNTHVIRLLRQRRTEGDKVILWTCRCGKRLEEAVAWCKGHGLDFDAINDNLPENIEAYGNNCRKVWADEYWDDKSVIVNTGYRPGLLRRNEEGGYTALNWSRETLTIVRKPLLARLRRWWKYVTEAD